MAKKNQLTKPKDSNCLNCGFPFTGYELFCPNCGQKNKGNRITFGSFVKEVFAGFFSWDTKFWRTLFTLLIAPGKISKDYIQGKRERYANPFRFYITASILFFLFYGINEKYTSFKKLSKTSSTSTQKAKIAQIDVDSIKSIISTEFDRTQKIIDSVDKASKKSKGTNIFIPKIKKDSSNTDSTKFASTGVTRLDSFMTYSRRNPEVNVNDALDSLHYEKTNVNRFLYNRAQLANQFFKEKEKRQMFLNKTLSYGSISLFIFLPIFTLALKILYIRKRYTYVDHLIFVFHTQTVFFIILTILMIITLFTSASDYIGISLLLFLLYLFIAMKRFYGQGYIKTFIKYFMLNFVYMFLASIGIALVGISAFALF